MVNLDFFFSREVARWGMHLWRRFIYRSIEDHLNKNKLQGIFDPLLGSRVIRRQSCTFWLAGGHFLAGVHRLREAWPEKRFASKVKEDQ